MGVTATTLTTVGTVSVGLYLLRKLRELQWGWVRDTSDLGNRVFVITGANTGLGFETALALAKRNATIIMACRDTVKADMAIEKIKNQTTNGKLIAMELDLADFKSIRTFADKITEVHPNIYALIANAGVATSRTDLRTRQGHEIHVGVNHLGHFLLIVHLLENLKKANTRIVFVSSSLHQTGDVYFKAEDSQSTTSKTVINPMYKNSKLMNFYFARHLFAHNFNVYVVCPGFCYTDLFRDFKPKFYQLLAFIPIMCFMMRTAKQGAQSIIHCATAHTHTRTQNPMTGYFVKNLKETKSTYKFTRREQGIVWRESKKMADIGDIPAIKEFHDDYDHRDASLEYVLENMLPPDDGSDEYKVLRDMYSSSPDNGCACSLNCLDENCSHGQSYKPMKNGELGVLPEAIERGIIYECTDNCNCIPKICVNRCLQWGPRPNLRIENFSTLGKGICLFTSTFINKGAFICEYAGEYLTKAMAQKRHAENTIKKRMNYIFCVNEFIAGEESNREPIQTFIDPSQRGNIGRYISHSCDPNCVMAVIRLESPLPRLGIFAKRKIEKSEELTIDYAGYSRNQILDPTDIGSAGIQLEKCLCFSEKCRTYLPYQKY